jgi:integrase
MVRRIPDTLQGNRDKALLLLGFAVALRRSDLVALEVADLERMPEGILVHIRRSKTDQEGEGHKVAVPRGSQLKPVEALEDWLRSARVETGPVFRTVKKGGMTTEYRLSEGSVASIAKRYAEAAGLDPKTFSGHSLRAGFVTSALEAGADFLKVMDVSRHREVKTLKAYDRRAKAFKNHAGKGFLRTAHRRSFVTMPSSSGCQVDGETEERCRSQKRHDVADMGDEIASGICTGIVFHG